MFIEELRTEKFCIMMILDHGIVVNGAPLKVK